MERCRWMRKPLKLLVVLFVVQQIYVRTWPDKSVKQQTLSSLSDMNAHLAVEVNRPLNNNKTNKPNMIDDTCTLDWTCENGK